MRILCALFAVVFVAVAALAPVSLCACDTDEVATPLDACCSHEAPERAPRAGTFDCCEDCADAVCAADDTLVTVPVTVTALSFASATLLPVSTLPVSTVGVERSPGDRQRSARAPSYIQLSVLRI